MIIQSVSSNGITKKYYIRFAVLGLIFSLILASFFIFAVDTATIPLIVILSVFAANMLLFPFSRYVIDSVINFAYDDGMLVKSEIGSIVINFFLWALAIFVAPLYLLGYVFKTVRNKMKK